jgi:alpha-ketoglutarate-dependent taurine dioxygenase
MWDNRCTQHRVTADYFWRERDYTPSRRRMHRVSVRGHVPYN